MRPATSRSHTLALTLLAAALLTLPCAALAQQGQQPQLPQQFVGTWYCRFSNESLTGLATDTWMWEFYMALYQDGKFEAQGQYWANSAGFYDPFYASGQWQGEGNAMIAQGQHSRQSGMAYQWLVTGNMTGEGIISYRSEDQYNRMLVYCELVPPQRQ